jgi:hypothetical protein
MKKWSYIRIVGLLAAVVLIVFGGIDNTWRTVKFGLERFFRS